jgi:hypothetical protein
LSRLSLPAAILAVAGVVYLALTGIRAGNASGSLDQTLTGNPDCSFQNFQGSVSSSQPIRQEFVAGRLAITGLDLCLNAEFGTLFSFAIRDGTIEAPRNARINGGATTAGPYEWTHLDFGSVTVLPGEAFLIELGDTSQFAWVATCPAAVGSCNHVDADLYPPGESSDNPNRDFVFRTYGSDGPTPTPFGALWGDFDCSSSVNALDGLARLMTSSGLTPDRSPSCPALDGNVFVDGMPVVWGNFDCIGNSADVLDALAIFKYLAEIAFPTTSSCPAAGEAVIVTRDVY